MVGPGIDFCPSRRRAGGDGFDKILTHALERLAKLPKPDELSECLRVWATSCLPLLTLEPRGSGVTAECASRMLILLGNLDHSRLPSEVVAAIPFIAAVAPEEARQGFRETALGGLLAQMGIFATDSKTQTPVVPLTREHLISQLVEYLTKEEERRLELERAVRALSEEARSLRSDVERTAFELRSAQHLYKTELTNLTGEVDRRESELHALRDELHIAKEEVAKWQSEVRVLDRESRAREMDHEKAQQAELAERLVKPARNVRDHLANMLAADTAGDDLRQAGIALNTLLRRISKVCNGVELEPLAMQLLDPNGSVLDG